MKLYLTVLFVALASVVQAQVTTSPNPTSYTVYFFPSSVGEPLVAPATAAVKTVTGPISPAMCQGLLGGPLPVTNPRNPPVWLFESHWDSTKACRFPMPSTFPAGTNYVGVGFYTSAECGGCNSPRVMSNRFDIVNTVNPLVAPKGFQVP